MPISFVLATLVVAADFEKPPASPDPATLTVPAATTAEARDLVRRLGSDTFRDRDAAFRDLRQMGRLALPGLRAGATADADPEVRYRCGLLLPAAAEDDFHARLTVFLADVDGKHTHDLPGWAQFQARTGHDPRARELFADMLRDEGTRRMLAGIAVDKAELAGRVIARRQALTARLAGTVFIDPRRDVTLVEAAGLVFCEALLGEKYAPAEPRRVRGRGSVTVYSLFSRGMVTVSFTGDRYGPAVRALLVGWLDARETAAGLAQAVDVTTRHGMPEGKGYATKLLGAQGASPLLKASALFAIAQLGTRDDVKLMVPLLADESVVRQTSSYDVQVRDVALAMAAQMTGRDPTVFGMEARSGGYYGYSSYSHWFPTAEDRDKALAAWAKLEPSLAPPKPDGEKHE